MCGGIEMISTHNHTRFSPDSNTEINALCDKAVNKNMKGIAITDHYDFCIEGICQSIEPIKESFSAANSAKDKYKNRLIVLSGIEIGGMMWAKKQEEGLVKSFDFDVVINSVHHIEKNGEEVSFFYDDFTPESAKECIDIYFDTLLYVAKNMNGDILAHITYPYRYLNGNWKFGLMWQDKISEIEEIFKILIKREKAIEINTAHIGKGINDFSPNEEIVALYRKMGGELITIGSDCHTENDVDRGFLEAKEMLKRCGFSDYYYFEKRKPKKVSL